MRRFFSVAAFSVDLRSLLVDDEEGAAPAGYLLGIGWRILARMRLQLPKSHRAVISPRSASDCAFFQSFILFQRILRPMRSNDSRISRVPVFGASAACVC